MTRERLGMPTDAERWRFVADHRLALHTDGGDYLVHWLRTGGPGQPPAFYPVSSGLTPEEAVDKAIARYQRKHHVQTTESKEDSGMRTLTVRGWLS
jgi:hypothetical protein